MLGDASAVPNIIPKVLLHQGKFRLLQEMMKARTDIEPMGWDGAQDTEIFHEPNGHYKPQLSRLRVAPKSQALANNHTATLYYLDEPFLYLGI